MILNKQQQKRFEQFDRWLEGLHLQTLTDDLKSDIREEIEALIEELKELEA